MQSGPDRKVRGRVTWEFEFLWVPGRGEASNLLPDEVQPWWENKGFFPELYPNLVDPSMLLSDVTHDKETGEDNWGLGDGDGGSSKGWHCSDCGKLNRQTLWRRRKCGSQMCKVMKFLLMKSVVPF